jgi:2-isopropylmalate synthase
MRPSLRFEIFGIVLSLIMEKAVYLYDTTLRDGTQGEGINFSVADKLAIAERLDAFGMDYIEGGWPGSNEKDIEFFKAAQNHRWHHAKIAAFGSTRRVKTSVEKDDQVRLLLEAKTPVVTIFGKSWLLHVAEILKTTPEENLAMIEETVRFLKEAGREVIYDAEHFFDGYKDQPDYAVACLKAAERGGADFLVLCDTNGGSLPSEIGQITRQVKTQLKTNLGIHTHNDSDLGVANALAAIEEGARQVQGTMNGYGERTGNCNLTSVIPNLQLKLKKEVVSDESLARLRELSLFVDDIANQHHNMRAPFVGESSFAHKGGMHVNAVNKVARSFEHIEPARVGNHQRILVGELSGRTNIFMKAREMGVTLEEKAPETKAILQQIKALEARGYEFESADASFELLVRKVIQHHQPWFELEEYHVSIRKSPLHHYEVAEATVKLKIKGQQCYTVAEGDGPVNALDNALRAALLKFYPSIQQIRLQDYKVRIIDSNQGTEARTRVLIRSSAEDKEWATLGVSENLVEASWQALVDSVEYFLLKYSQETSN